MSGATTPKVATPTEPKEERTSRRRSILTLLLFTIFVPELISGSTPPTHFILNPIIAVLFILAYGLPILLIRELATRFKIGTTGLIFVGIAYGIHNEGLMARTLLAHQNLPINAYDNYGFFAGVSFPWLAFIGPWHALMSVLFPITFTQFANPKTADRPWLSVGWSVVLTLFLLAASIKIFLSPIATLPAGQPWQLFTLLGLMAIFFALGFLFKGRSPSREGLPETKAIWLGTTQFIPFFLLAALAGRNAPLPVFALTLAGIFLFYSRFIEAKEWFTVLGVLSYGTGMYATYGFFAIIFSMKIPLEGVLVAIINILIVTLLWRRLNQPSSPAKLATA